MYCTNCGFETNAQDKFCRSCGEVLEKKSTKEKPVFASQSSSSIKGMSIKNAFSGLFGISVLLLVTFCLVYALYKMVIVGFRDSFPWFLGIGLVLWVLSLHEKSLEARNWTKDMRRSDDPDFYDEQINFEEQYRFYAWAVGIGGGLVWLLIKKILS